jgi:hypothetical protein
MAMFNHRVVHEGFVGMKVTWCRVSFEHFGFLLPITISPVLHIMAAMAGTIGPFEAALPLDSVSHFTAATK